MLGVVFELFLGLGFGQLRHNIGGNQLLLILRQRIIGGASRDHRLLVGRVDLLEQRGFEITRLMPDAGGAIRVGDVAAALREDTALVSLMLVNNETGGVTDIAGVARMLRESTTRPAA